MIDLENTYRQLATSTQEGLVARYRDAEQCGSRLAEAAGLDFSRPIPLLASAVPLTATVSVATHVLHAVPASAPGDLHEQLLDTAARSAADALHRCHRALALDGAVHGYTPEEWLPVVYRTAEHLLGSASPDQNPPTAVRLSQEAISYLARALVELDAESSESATTLTDVLARLLAVWVFSVSARRESRPSD